ncbi:MAG: phenylalanine--tRNA ligase subunit alpha [Candidatus Paceibacterota bacterium]|jgi:phenylalanyl-tRNA synthetase alpha chain|nr:phenylalanine--tRNA ligase subunit alpha [bacterium]
MEFQEIKNTIASKIKKIANTKELKEFSNEYLGKKGEIRKLFSELKNLSAKEKKNLGQELNQFSNEMEQLVFEMEQNFKISQKISQKSIDSVNIELPGEPPEVGHIHPLTTVKNEMEHIFELMGFSVVEGLEVEDEWHNFDSLNIPEGHPARDALSLGKTFYLKNGGVMRSQTSSAQTRYMKKMKPPIKIVIPGRVYRYEKTDASHEINFYQLEGIYIDENVSVANLKAILEKFLQKFFQKKVEIRLRPSYFPFTEPSFEVDMLCSVCGGKGCSTCKKTGWVELLGCGMIHPNVIKNGGLDPNQWKGFAFGLSIDRPAMMKYKINDIRLFHSGNLKFLKQF